MARQAEFRDRASSVLLHAGLAAADLELSFDLVSLEAERWDELYRQGLRALFRVPLED